MNAPVQAAPAAPSQFDFDKRVDQFVKLRDKIKAKQDAFKKEIAPYVDALETLGNMLLNHLNQIGAENVKTAHGTVHHTTKRTASIADKTAFWNWVLAQQQWDLLDYKANAVAVKDYIDSNGVPPPGVNYTERRKWE